MCDMGTVYVSEYVEETFTIENAGTGDLELTGEPMVLLGRGYEETSTYDDFSVTQPAASTLAPGAWTTFTVRYAPTEQSPTADEYLPLEIGSNDPANASFLFFCSGRAYQAAMTVEYDATGATLTDGSTTPLQLTGSIEEGASVDRSFTITSTGYYGNLELDGSPAVSVIGSGAFTVQAQPVATSLAYNGTATFTIRFAPTEPGSFTATVSVPNNTPNADPFDFVVGGTAVEWAGTKSLRVGVGSDVDLEYYYAQSSAQLAIAYTNTIDTDVLYYFVSDWDANGSSWTGTPVALATASATDVSLDIDYMTANVAFYDWTSQDVVWTTAETDAADAWTAGAPETVKAAGNVGYGTELDTDGDSGLMYLSYWDVDAGLFCVDVRDPHYLSNGTAEWTLRTPEPTSSAGSRADTALTLGTAPGTVMAAYYSPSELAVKFVKSTNGGSTWTAPVTIDSFAAAFVVDGKISIAADTNHVYVAYWDWLNDDLKVARSADGGATWTKTSVDSTGSVGYHADIALYDPTPGTTTKTDTVVAVVWTDDTNSDLKFTKSTDSGTTWPAANVKVVDDGTAVTMRSPSLEYVHGSDKDRVFVAYVRGEYLCFAKSVTGGSTW